MTTNIYKNYKKLDFLDCSNNSINPTDEMVKAFITSLKIPKGTFSLEEETGCNFLSELHNLSENNFKEDLLCLLKKYAQEFQHINVESVEKISSHFKPLITLLITLSADGNTYFVPMEVEVKI